MHRLEELMHWQQQQQKKLIHHQQAQKELLSQEQRRLYEVFGLGKIEVNTDASGAEHPLEEDVIYVRAGETEMSSSSKPMFSVHDESPYTNHVTNMKLPSPVLKVKSDEMNAKRAVNLDEIPIQTPVKDFYQLLQKKLEVEGSNANGNSTNVQAKPKRKYLKKGEGLSRFNKKSGDGKSSIQYPKPKAKSSKSTTSTQARQPGPLQLTKPSSTNPVRAKKNEKSEPSPPRQRAEKPPVNRKLVLKATDQQLCPLSTWSHVLKSGAVGNNPNSSAESPGDFEKKTKKELEELKMFEQLEQHAANSSFCSTSSLVARLMECSARSTPRKHTIRNHIPEEREYEEKFPVRNIHGLNDPLEINSRQFESHIDHGVQTENANRHFTEFLPVTWAHNQNSKSNIEDKYVERKFSNVNVTQPHCTDQWELKNRSEVLNQNDKCESECEGSCVVVEIPETDSCVVIEPQENGLEPEEKDSICTNELDDRAWSDACSCTSCEGCESSSDISSPNARSKSASMKSRSPCKKTEAVHMSCNNINTVDLVNSSANDNVQFLRDTETNTEWQQKEDSGYNFKSALLRTRLEELEKEISIFQTENTNLLKAKKQHQEELLKYKQERKQFEKKLNEEREKMMEMVQEERKKLSRERHVFEKHIKCLKNQPNRAEREEIKSLKFQIENLQEEIKRKDSRWSASQVRAHKRVQQLEKQITQLKEENETLKRDMEKVKRVRFAPIRAKTSSSKAMHVINEQLGKLKVTDVDEAILIKNVVPKKRIPTSILAGAHVPSNNSNEEKNEWGRKMHGQPRQFNSVPDLEPVTSSICLDQEEIINDIQEDQHNSEDSEREDNDVSEEEQLNDSFQETEELNKEHEKLVYNALYSTLEEMNESSSTKQPSVCKEFNLVEEYIRSLKSPVQEGKLSKTVESVPATKTFISSDTAADEPSKEPEDMDYANSSSEQKQTNKNDFVETMQDNGNREKLYQDGRLEIWYPNGNVKKVSADKLSTKIIYYNGDVKKKLIADGIEKYYYAETRTWHTTYKDGLEVLEFPNGQVERHHPNGTVEISYANSCVQLRYPDGHEEWAMADGTVVKMDAEGSKVLLLPNGQREIHSKEHKRREYPDGTVKFLYPDGAQETRYTNGRIRLKDKDGKLIMDSSAS